MKMKKSVFIGLFIFLVSSVFAKEIYITPKIQLKNGIAKEYVYDGSHKLSQLDWKVENLTNFGVSSEFFLNKLFLAFEFSSGLYNFGGKMEDYDWLDYENPQHYVRYSSHDLIVSENFNFSFDLGFHFPINTSKNLGKVFFQFDFWESKFVGANGFRYYEDWEKYGNAAGTFSGVVITYNPIITSFFLGIGSKCYFGNSFSLEAESLISFATFGTCIDNHVLSNGKFVDYVRGSFFGKLDFSLAYDFSETYSLVLGGKVENLPPIYGKSFVNNMLSAATGGFSSFFYEIYLSYRIRML